jgi:hypothetical protein
MSNRSATSVVTLKFNSTISNALDTTAGGGGPSVSQATIDATLLSGNIPNGINAGQANRAWASISRALGSGGNETLDLYQMIGLDIGAGSGNDALGQACLFEEIVCIIIKCEDGSAGQLQVEPGTSNPLNALGSLTVANGGALRAKGVRLWFESDEQGIDLSPTKKSVKFTAMNGAVTYSIYIIGRNDDDESSSSSSLSSSSSTSSSSSSKSSSSSSSSSSVLG